MLQDWRLGASRCALYMVLNARTGFDTLRSDTRTTDKRVAINAAALRESFGDPQTKSGARWSPGAQHIADASMKRYGNSVPSEVLTECR